MAGAWHRSIAPTHTRTYTNMHTQTTNQEDNRSPESAEKGEVYWESMCKRQVLAAATALEEVTTLKTSISELRSVVLVLSLEVKAQVDDESSSGPEVRPHAPLQYTLTSCRGVSLGGVPFANFFDHAILCHDMSISTFYLVLIPPKNTVICARMQHEDCCTPTHFFLHTLSPCFPVACECDCTRTA